MDNNQAVAAAHALHAIIGGTLDLSYMRSKAHQYDAFNEETIAVILQKIACENIARTYVLEPSVVGLATGMLERQIGKPAPMPYFACDGVYLFICDMVNEGQAVKLTAFIKNTAYGVCVVEYMEAGDGNAYGFSCYVHTPEGKISPGALFGREETAGMLTRIAALSVCEALIDARHVTAVPRVSKARDKINGKVTKTKRPYKVGLIDVDRDVIAHETTARHTESTGTRRGHYVRSHLRLKRGKIEVVRAHTRGDFRLGSSSPVSRVIASQHKPNQ